MLCGALCIIMKMKKTVMAFVALSLLAAAGCKPTESNYKAAYDAAQKKRQAADADSDIALPTGGLQAVDAPRKRVVDGDTVSVAKMPLRFDGGLEQSVHRWNVAVACYKMQTNCAAQVSELFTKGYKAYVAETTGGRFYTIAGTFETLHEAAAFAREYAATHGREQFIGLEGAPLIIER